MKLIIRNSKEVLGAVEGVSNETISDLKKTISEQFNFPVNGMILIFQGRTMEDEFSLNSFNLKEGETIYLVTKEIRKPVKIPKPKPFDPSRQMNYQMGKMLLKMVENNPDGYMNLIESNPAFKQAIESNPELKFAMNDPDLMKQQIELMLNPDNADLAARTFDNMLDYIETIPGGFSAIHKAVNSLGDPIMDSIKEQMHQNGSDITRTPIEELKAPSVDPLPKLEQPQNNQMAMLLRMFGQGNFDRPLAKEGLQNIAEGIRLCKENGFDIELFLRPNKILIPDERQMYKRSSSSTNKFLQNFGNSMGFDFGNSMDPFSDFAQPYDYSFSTMGPMPYNLNHQQPQQQRKMTLEELKDLYAPQLARMSEMGLNDIGKNIEALQKTNGNLNRAIDLILGKD